MTRVTLLSRACSSRTWMWQPSQKKPFTHGMEKCFRSVALALPPSAVLSTSFAENHNRLVRQGRTRNCCSVKATVTVMPKRSVLDPQGAATAEAMKHLGLDNVARVRVGKSIEIELQSAVDETKLHQIARDLLSNPIIE